MKKRIRVGGGLQEAAQRVATAWRRAARGEKVEPQDNVTFASWSALAAVMTDKRHELLRHLHREPAPSIRALARALGRDYKRVHVDVEALTAASLVEQRGGLLRADYDEIQAVIRVKDAA
jgi:predicted transcriptional regulator